MISNMSRLNPFKMPVQNRFAALSENYVEESNDIKKKEVKEVKEVKEEKETNNLFTEPPRFEEKRENVFKKPLVWPEPVSQQQQQHPRVSFYEQRMQFQKQEQEKRVNLFLQQKKEEDIKNQPVTEDSLDIEAEQDFPTLFQPKLEKTETNATSSFTAKLKEALARKEVEEVVPKKKFFEEEEVVAPVGDRALTPMEILNKLCELYAWQERWGRYWYGNEAYNEMYGIENKRSYEYFLKRRREKEVILPDESESSDCDVDYFEDDMDNE